MRSDLRTVDDLRAHLAALGSRPLHTQRILAGWLRGQDIVEMPAANGARRPRSLQAALAGVQDRLRYLVTGIATVPAADSCRRLLRLASGHVVEAVDLPRFGLCVSTQVGCAVGCTFCKTGENGLLRQLSSLEILAQVALARRERPVRRVVFMGMGEPSHNLDSVLDAIGALGVEGGLPHKNLVFSTVGDPSLFPRLREGRVRPALALSLHTLDGDLRGRLLPRAPRVEPTKLLDAALDHADRTGHPLQIQWTLLEGSNDSIEDAGRLAERVSGRRAIVNYIPCNSLEGSGHRRPDVERCVELVRTVRSRGGIATLRFSVGQEIEAGCGQLRARV